ncbi:hypothetical protein ACWCRF_38290 [Streptomyces sp. NPDC002405]
MDPDDAVKVSEGVAYVVSKLSGEQRDKFLSLLETITREEAGPSRQTFLEEFPDGCCVERRGAPQRVQVREHQGQRPVSGRSQRNWWADWKSSLRPSRSLSFPHTGVEAAMARV